MNEKQVKALSETDLNKMLATKVEGLYEVALDDGSIGYSVYEDGDINYDEIPAYSTDIHYMSNLLYHMNSINSYLSAGKHKHDFVLVGDIDNRYESKFALWHREECEPEDYYLCVLKNDHGYTCKIKSSVDIVRDGIFVESTRPIEFSATAETLELSVCYALLMANSENEVDDDILKMSDREKTFEIHALRNSIRRHRDEKGNDRCWLDDRKLYLMLPESNSADFSLPPKEEFLKNCERFYECRSPK